MSGAIFIYEGYSLEMSQDGYRSNIDGRIFRFDTAGQWKKFIDYRKHGKDSKKGHRN